MFHLRVRRDRHTRAATDKRGRAVTTFEGVERVRRDHNRGSNLTALGIAETKIVLTCPNVS
jgi:hypothetical protein